MKTQHGPAVGFPASPEVCRYDPHENKAQRAAGLHTARSTNKTPNSHLPHITLKPIRHYQHFSFSLPCRISQSSPRPRSADQGRTAPARRKNLSRWQTDRRPSLETCAGKKTKKKTDTATSPNNLIQLSPVYSLYPSARRAGRHDLKTILQPIETFYFCITVVSMLCVFICVLHAQTVH